MDPRQPIELSRLNLNLEKVPENFSQKPAMVIKDFAKKLGRVKDIFEAYDEAKVEIDKGLAGEVFDYYQIDKYIRLYKTELWERVFTEEEIAAIRFSRTCCESTVDTDRFRDHPNFRLLDKIVLSAWHCGSISRLDWNYTVDVYNAVRNFTTNQAGFTYFLDITTGGNEFGYSQFTRTFLDGELAILLYYKGTHAITIGFDISQDRVKKQKFIGIKQIQLKQQKGNRFLFSLPTHYLEFLVANFTKAFGSLQVRLVDKDEVAKLATRGYDSALAWMKKDEPDFEIISAKRKHLLEEVAPRLRKLYGQRFTTLRRGRKTKGYSIITLK